MTSFRISISSQEERDAYLQYVDNFLAHRPSSVRHAVNRMVKEIESKTACAAHGHHLRKLRSPEPSFWV